MLAEIHALFLACKGDSLGLLSGDRFGMVRSPARPAARYPHDMAAARRTSGAGSGGIGWSFRCRTGSGISGFRVAMGLANCLFGQCLSSYGTWPESSIRTNTFQKGVFDAQLKEWGNKRLCPTTGKTVLRLNKDPIISPYSGRSASR